MHVVALARVQQAAPREPARRRTSVVDHVKESKVRAARPAVARRRPEGGHVERASAQHAQVLLERGDVFASRARGGHELVVPVGAREKLAQDSEELPAVAVAHEQRAISPAQRAAAVQDERARQAHGALDSRRVVVLAGPCVVDGVDAGGGGEGLDVVGGEIREIPEQPRHLRAREPAQSPRDVGEGGGRLLDGPGNGERIVSHEGPVHEDDEPDARAAHPLAQALHGQAPIVGSLRGERGERDACGLDLERCSLRVDGRSDLRRSRSRAQCCQGVPGCERDGHGEHEDDEDQHRSARVLIASASCRNATWPRTFAGCHQSVFQGRNCPLITIRTRSLSGSASRRARRPQSRSACPRGEDQLGHVASVHDASIARATFQQRSNGTANSAHHVSPGHASRHARVLPLPTRHRPIGRRFPRLSRFSA